MFGSHLTGSVTKVFLASPPGLFQNYIVRILITIIDSGSVLCGNFHLLFCKFDLRVRFSTVFFLEAFDIVYDRWI